MSTTEKALPPLPEAEAQRAEWEAGWSQYHDDSDPMPLLWEDGEAPERVLSLFTADQMHAYARAALAAQEQAEPVGYMSPKQTERITDPDGEFGVYIPMRKTPAGNFTLALYTHQPAAQPAQPVAVPTGRLDELDKRRIFDAIRDAYSLGYIDARNSKAIPGDNAPGYEGRKVETDHGNALIRSLEARRQSAQPVADRWHGDHNIESPNNACMHKGYCLTLKAQPVAVPDALLQDARVLAEHCHKAMEGMKAGSKEQLALCAAASFLEVLAASPAPEAREPLTREQISAIYCELTAKARKTKDPRHGDVLHIARAIEIAHGIKAAE